MEQGTPFSAAIAMTDLIELNGHWPDSGVTNAVQNIA